MNKTIYLVTGFSGMGKDYLLTRENIRENYVSFYPKGKEIQLPTTFKGMERHCFAQTLKDLIEPLFGLTIPDEKYNEIKDQPGVLYPYEGSIRDYFMEIAIAIKKVDNNFFVKRVAKSIALSNSDNFVITDLRFPEELEAIREELPGCDIYTIRVHRVFGPKPKLDVISENSLLAFSPDIVLLTIDNKDEDMVSYNLNYIT